MKKLALFFILLVSLVIVAGCNRSKNPEESNAEDSLKTEAAESTTETTIKKVEDSDESAPIFSIDIGKKEAEKNEPASSIKITEPSEPTIKTNKSYHVLRGSIEGDQITTIKVNGSELSSYKIGNTDWKYIVSTTAKNLKVGQNKYLIEGLNKNGEIVSSATQLIEYSEIKDGKLASTGNPLAIPFIISLIFSFFLKKKNQ